MTYYRRVLAIVTRSFYRHRRQHITHINRYIHSTKQSHHPTLHPSSTHLLSYHYHKYTTSTTTTNNLKPTISIESKNASNTSLKRRLIFIAAVTTLSYLGYKYYMYGKTDTNEQSQQTNTSPLNRAIYRTATDMIEKSIINGNLAFKMGLFMDNRKQYRKALYFYKLYLRRPKNKQGEYAALNNMSILYYKLNEYDNALIAFELLGKQQIVEKNLEFLRAHCYHINKQYPNALKWYLKFLKNKRSKQSDIMAAYNNLALLYYEMGKYDKSLEHFNKLGDNVIKEKNYSFRVAHSLQNTNDFDKAVAYYNEYLSNPDTTKENILNTYHNLGVLFYKSGKDKEAKDMFDKLGDDQISKRNLEFKMAHLCAKTGDKRGAIKYLNGCKNKPEIYGEYTIVCQGIMAQILYEVADYEAAVIKFDELGEEEIIKQDLFFPAGFSYYRCEEFEKALNFFNLLLSHKQNTLTEDEMAYVYSRICLIYYKQRDYMQALNVINNQLFDEFITRNNMEFVVAHSNHKLGEYTKAQIYYNKFLENEKSDEIDIINCYQNLALLYYDLNNFNKCIEYLVLITDDMIIERALEFYMAHSLQECNRYEDSIKYYKLFLDKLEAKTDVSENDLLNKLNTYQNLGSVYYTLNQWENAFNTWSKLSDADIIQRNLALKLSKCYDMMGDDDNKSKYLQLASETNMKQNIEKIRLAKMYYNMYQNELAVRIFEKIDDEDIITNDAAFIIAHAYQLIGETEKAIKYYKMGLEYKESDIEVMDKNKKDEISNAYHNLGCAYFDNEEHKHAIECFDKLTTEHVMKTSIEFIIGVSYHNISDYSNAIKYYKLFLDNPMNRGKGIEDINMVNCYNNMVILYYYHLNDYINAWDILQKMGDKNIKEKKLEFEIAHCAQQLNKNKISLMYYQSFLINTPSNQLSDKVIDRVYNNIVIMCENDNDLDKNMFDEFKNNKHDNKYTELRLFLKWINNEANVD